MIAEHPTITLRTYATVFIALIALLLLTVALAFIPTHHETTRDLLTATGFLIAAAKAMLIILYFMHVRYGTRLTWIFAAASFLWLGILLVMTLNDYMTRQTAAHRADPVRESLNPIVTSDQQRGPIDRP